MSQLTEFLIYMACLCCGTSTMVYGFVYPHRHTRVGECTKKTSARFFMIASCIYAVGDVVAGHRFNLCIDAAFFAVNAYIWWTHGGGGTMQRLGKKIKSLFAVPQLAPQSA